MRPYKLGPIWIDGILVPKPDPKATLEELAMRVADAKEAGAKMELYNGVKCKPE